MKNGEKFKEVFKDTIADVGYDGLTNITKVSLFHNQYVLYFLKGWWNAEYTTQCNDILDSLGLYDVDVRRIQDGKIGRLKASWGSNNYLYIKFFPYIKSDHQLSYNPSGFVCGEIDWIKEHFERAEL